MRTSVDPTECKVPLDERAFEAYLLLLQTLDVGVVEKALTDPAKAVSTTLVFLELNDVLPVVTVHPDTEFDCASEAHLNAAFELQLFPFETDILGILLQYGLEQSHNA